jgi:hypothetical protein
MSYSVGPISFSERLVWPFSLMVISGMAIRKRSANQKIILIFGKKRSRAIGRAIAKSIDCSAQQDGP